MGWFLFFLSLVFLGMVMTAFMAPTIVAFRNGHEQRWIIFLTNVFAAWTGIAWFPIMLWACKVFQGPALDHATVTSTLQGMQRQSRPTPAHDPRQGTQANRSRMEPRWP